VSVAWPGKTKRRDPEFSGWKLDHVVIYEHDDDGEVVGVKDEYDILVGEWSTHVGDKEWLSVALITDYELEANGLPSAAVLQTLEGLDSLDAKGKGALIDLTNIELRHALEDLEFAVAEARKTSEHSEAPGGSRGPVSL
jgi:hypothetical protein